MRQSEEKLPFSRVQKQYLTSQSPLSIHFSRPCNSISHNTQFVIMVRFLSDSEIRHRLLKYGRVILLLINACLLMGGVMLIGCSVWVLDEARGFVMNSFYSTAAILLTLSGPVLHTSGNDRMRGIAGKGPRLAPDLHLRPERRFPAPDHDTSARLSVRQWSQHQFPGMDLCKCNTLFQQHLCAGLVGRSAVAIKVLRDHKSCSNRNNN